MYKYADFDTKPTVKDPTKLLLRRFVEEFQEAFFKKLNHYEKVSRGEISQVGLAGEIGGPAMGALVGAASLGISGPSVLGPGASAGNKVGTLICGGFSKWKHERKATDIVHLTQFLQRENRKLLTHAVIRSAVQIFITFEQQFLNQVSVSRNLLELVLCAKSGVARILQYIHKAHLEFDYTNPLGIGEFLAKAAIYGKNKSKERFWDPVKSVLLCNKWYSSQMYELAGVAGNYHKKGWSISPAIYGYRRPLPGEIESSDFETFYEHVDTNCPTECEYVLLEEDFEDLVEFCTPLGEDLTKNVQLLYKRNLLNFFRVLSYIKDLPILSFRLTSIDALCDVMTQNGHHWTSEMIQLAQYGEHEGSETLSKKVPLEIRALIWAKGLHIFLKNEKTNVYLDSPKDRFPLVLTSELDENNCFTQSWRIKAQGKGDHISLFNCWSACVLDSNQLGQVHIGKNNKGDFQSWQVVPVLENGAHLLKFKNKSTRRYLSNEEGHKVTTEEDHGTKNSSQYWTMRVPTGLGIFE